MSKINFNPFDPHLRSAMGEIERVLEKYGIGGQVDLVSKTHVEFRLFVPKWAPHTKDPKTGMVVFHYREADPEGSKLITHFITAMHEQAMRTFLLMEDYYNWLEETFKPEHYRRGPIVRSPEDLPDPEGSNDAA